MEELYPFGVWYREKGILGNQKIIVRAKDKDHAIELFKELIPNYHLIVRVFETKEMK